MKNLFNEDVQEPLSNIGNSPYLQRKRTMNYRKSDDPLIRCKNCLYCFRIDYHDKTYYKCRLIGESSSEATDIRISGVCNRFIKK